ncbi:hypothetical protein L596_007779 [Steinernema carpocapsae]|uniref:Uncharacterized protein n=1 Tax=Steinernema carpocapsae TaxID=34508 RepID=A0A4U5PAK8_STECR|nr:hypothetical protein L596_007779 [Steinernema carpocapsae]
MQHLHPRRVPFVNLRRFCEGKQLFSHTFRPPFFGLFQGLSAFLWGSYERRFWVLCAKMLSHSVGTSSKHRQL